VTKIKLALTFQTEFLEFRSRPH